jgi:3'-5' exoribonuclease
MFREHGNPAMDQKRFVHELRENEALTSPFLVKAKSLGSTRSGAPFLSVRLADRTGEMEGRVWERAAELDGAFGVNDVVRIRGRVERYREQLQVNITEIERIPREEVDPGAFLPRSAEDPEKLWKMLRELAAKVQNPHLTRLLQHFITDRSFSRQMKEAPAAKSMHHAYLGGLLEHTVSVTLLLERLCDHYPSLDRDLLITAGILHDVGKLEELAHDTALDYTDAGRLLGHVVLGVQRVVEKISQIQGFPPGLALVLQHLIISHHGEYDFGSPKRPKTPEAFALHYADDLDAKMNHLSRLLEAERATPSRWTTFQRVYDRFIFKGGTPDDHPPPETGRHGERSFNYSLLDQTPSVPGGEER